MAVYGVQPVKETDVPKLIDLIRADGLIEHLRLYQPDVLHACRDAGNARAGHTVYYERHAPLQ